MSDGNYNRNLLPYNNYQSGLKAGRATMKTLAITAFKQQISKIMPQASDTEIESYVNNFKKVLE